MSTVFCPHTSTIPHVALPARPEAIAFPPRQTALIVVDMQNAYATQGGYLDLAGFDVSATKPVIAKIHQAVTAARAAGTRSFGSKMAGTIGMSKQVMRVHRTFTNQMR